MNKPTLAIISHTEHYLTDSGEIRGWGPTVREINHLLEVFRKIRHVAPLHKVDCPKSALPYESDEIEFIPLKPAGGNGFLNKMSILFSMPQNLKIIHRVCQRTEWVQFRAPTNLGLYVLPYLSLKSKPNRWVKYAGNWAQENPPFSYLIQRWWLNKNFQNSKVTINGNWENQKSHLLSFENPCLTEKELAIANKIAEMKNYHEKLNMCFVGRLETAKGVDRLIKALISLQDTSWIDTVYFVGDGQEREVFQKQAKVLTDFSVQFTGWLSRPELNDIYSKCHLFILPSASEGFPKVIAEAAAFGCVPLVSDVSSIGQYVKHNKSGLVFNDISNNLVASAFVKLSENRIRLEKMAREIVKIARLFTYSRYNERIKKEILSF